MFSVTLAPAYVAAGWMPISNWDAQRRSRLSAVHYGTLQLASILDGMHEFAKAYRGELATETMLVKSLDEYDE